MIEVDCKTAEGLPPELMEWVVFNLDTVRNTALSIHQDRLNKEKQGFSPDELLNEAPAPKSVYGTPFCEWAASQYGEREKTALAAQMLEERAALGLEIAKVRTRRERILRLNKIAQRIATYGLIGAVGIIFGAALLGTVVPAVAAVPLAISLGAMATVSVAGMASMIYFDSAHRRCSFQLIDLSDQDMSLRRGIKSKIESWNAVHKKIAMLHGAEAEERKNEGEMAFVPAEKFHDDTNAVNAPGAIRTTLQETILSSWRSMALSTKRGIGPAAPKALNPAYNELITLNDEAVVSQVDAIMKERGLVLPPPAKEGASPQAVAQAAKARQRVMHRASRVLRTMLTA